MHRGMSLRSEDWTRRGGGRIIHRTVRMTTTRKAACCVSLLHMNLTALRNLSFELLLANFSRLSEGDIERFVPDHFVVRISNSIDSLLGSREAHKQKAL